jgi:peptidoglycan/LPS O-acetylase OafA/YrhL
MKRKPAEKTKIYFPGVNGLRFFAAMLVVFSHIELLKEGRGWWWSANRQTGKVFADENYGELKH